MYSRYVICFGWLSEEIGWIWLRCGGIIWSCMQLMIMWSFWLEFKNQLWMNAFCLFYDLFWWFSKHFDWNKLCSGIVLAWNDWTEIIDWYLRNLSVIELNVFCVMDSNLTIEWRFWQETAEMEWNSISISTDQMDFCFGLEFEKWSMNECVFFSVL